MKKLLLIVAMFAVMHVQAEEWQLLGESEAGRHYVDRESLQWDTTQTIFRIMTNVQQYDDTAWLTLMEIDCQQATFAYIGGIKTQQDRILSQFDNPRPAEPISEASMPDQLRQQYCYSNDDLRLAQWESIGKSNIAEVFFDRASVRQSTDHARFVAETKVMPFKGNEETLSTLVFNCSDRTFTLLKANKLKDGKLEPIFDKPQPASPTSKTATLDKLANQFCDPTK